MDIKNEKVGDFVVVRIDGRIDTTNYTEFEKIIAEVIDGGEKNLVLDCKNLNYISSSGLRVFLITQKRLMGAGGKLHLCTMQPSIKEIFDISGFSTIFKIYDSEAEALSN
ncbi:MAG: STAS domain-containing protein [Prolixibacteraceae bacterium]|nr:STAS domain-containing protein [Prolixibacteraceae bacterium]